MARKSFKAHHSNLTPTVHRQEFADFSSFLRAANAPCSLADEKRSSRTNGASFCLSADYAHSERLAIEGVPEIEARINRLSDTLESLAGECPDSMRLEYDIYGNAPDVALYLSGEPECMTRFEFTPAERGNILSIVVSGGASGMTKSATIERRGAAVLALVDLLESAGYRVELTILFASRSLETRNICSTRINVKQAGEALDVTRLCYVLAHPSMLRRTVFSYWETLASLRYEFGFYRGGNYGSAADDDAEADLYVQESALDYFHSDESAQWWIQNALQTLGVKQTA